MPARVTVFTGTTVTAEQFVREYLLDSIDRAPYIEGCDGLSFGLNEATNPDTESVIVGVLGDADAFLNAEKPTWEEYVQDGTLTDGDVQHLSQGRFETIFGERGAELTALAVVLVVGFDPIYFDRRHILSDSLFWNIICGRVNYFTPHRTIRSLAVGR